MWNAQNQCVRAVLARLAAACVVTGVGTAALANVSQPQKLRSVLDETRDRRAAFYDATESSTLGRVASPAEYAASQKNWREHYTKKLPPLKLSQQERDELVRDYGRVTLFGKPRCAKAFALGITGAHVIDVQGRPELTVTGVDASTPAASVLKPGDVILGANQRLFPQWEDPRVPVGYAIAAAQTREFGGILTLHIARDGQFMTVEVKLPVGDAYGEKYPYDCSRSAQISQEALDYIIAHGDDTFWRNLYLMGVGDENAMAHVRDSLRQAQRTGRIASNWGGSYKLVALCEYYLLTGDEQIMPAIRSHVAGLEANQMGGGWSHGAPGGYGVMNSVGQVAFLGLTLAQDCGVEVDPDVLARAAELSSRFIGTYGAYGDHKPGVARYSQRAPNDNGKVPTHAVLFHLLGEERVAVRSARRAAYSYRTQMGGHAELIFCIGWSAVGASYAPVPEFRQFSNNMLWYYELARRRSGELDCLGHTRYGKATAAVGMIYTLPNQRLRITGAPLRDKPLFPIDSLGPAKPVTAPRTTPSPMSKVDVPEKWDVLLSAKSDAVRTATANAVQGDAANTWNTAKFDDASWKTMKGGEKFEVGGWDVLLRQRFTCNQTSYTALRVMLPNGVGGELFLNGQRIAAFDNYRPVRGTTLQTLDLDKRAIAALQRGENVLAARLSGANKQPLHFALAAGPGMAQKQTIEASPPDYGNNKRDGWVGTHEQHRRGVDWFFEDKTAEQIARFLPYPDWCGAQSAYEALAAKGQQAVPLLVRLIEDSHAGVRQGAWDAVAVMNSNGTLTEAQKSQFAEIAAKRVSVEDAIVGESLGRAGAPLAKGETLARLLRGIASMPDVTARTFATDQALKGLADRPALQVGVLRIVVDTGLEDNTIRTLGSAMGGISKHANLPEARDSADEIAVVLDEIAPDMRGMFTDGLMHGGMAVIDAHLDAELEQTPQLVAGMSRCFVKVPDTDWPGWAFVNLYLRRQLYRLHGTSASEIERAVAELKVADPGIGQAVKRDEPLAELAAWAKVLKRTKGEQAALSREAIKLADSDDPYERLVALSLVWPSHLTLANESRRYHGRRELQNVVCIDDPSLRLAVALRAARHSETNTPTHWLLIWESAATCQNERNFYQVVTPLARYFDTVAPRQRGTYAFRAIASAATLAEPLLGTPAETPTLAQGLCKTYATASNNGWYTHTRNKVHNLVKKLDASSAPAMLSAVETMRGWSGRQGNRDAHAPFNRDFSKSDLKDRLDEMEKLANEKRR